MSEVRLGRKVAISTGSSQGMGAEHTRRFAAEGARVIPADLQREAGEYLTIYDRWYKAD
jgi:3alpha(or 20beta)-hydroxysteroid dehydrogenase